MRNKFHHNLCVKRDKNLYTLNLKLKRNYFCDNNLVANVGVFSDNILRNVGVKKPVYYVDLNLDFL